MAYDAFPYAVKRTVWWKTDSDGYAAGVIADPDNPVLGVGSGALVRTDVVDVGRPDITRLVFTEKSGSIIRQKVDAGVEDFSEVTVTMARRSSALNALANNAKVNTTAIAGVQIGGSNISARTLNSLGMAYFVNESVYGSGGAIPGKWGSFVYPSCTIAPLGHGANQEAGENPQNTDYTLTPATGLRFATGELLSVLDLGFDDGEALWYGLEDMEYEWHLYSFWQDGVATTFTLPYKPIYSTATVGGENRIVREGTPIAVTSVNTTTGLVTLTAAGTSGHRVQVLYPTAYVPT